mgnify:CR=1 FL=1
MQFSVAIPAFKVRFLNEAIESVLSQTCADWELVIVDDCSPEDVVSVVAPYLSDRRISYYRNDKNCGAVDVVDNWNICLSRCTGDYVICMGDDDRLLPCCLAEYTKLIEKHPGLNVYHARTEIIDEEGEVVNLQEPRPEWESLLSLTWNRWATRNKQYIGDFCYSTSYLKEAGGYYKLPLAWGSDDVTAALAAKAKGIANTEEFCFQYRENAQTISSSPAHSKQKILATLEQHDWFSKLLDELSHEPLTATDGKYLKTIGVPRSEYYRNSLANDCIAYIHGRPGRLAWCMRQLKPFRYPVSLLFRWYLKSLTAVFS